MKVFLETARLILFCFFINFCIVLKFGSLTLTLTKTPDRRPFVGVSLLIQTGLSGQINFLYPSPTHTHSCVFPLSLARRDRHNFQNCISSAQIREWSLSDYCVLLKDVGSNSKIELGHHICALGFWAIHGLKENGSTVEPDNVEIQLFSNQIYF
jgi:hypothetical protein